MTSDSNPSPPRSGIGKWVLLIALASLALWAYWRWGDQLSLTSLASREAQLRTFQEQSPWLVYLCAFLIYTAVTGLSLPGAAALTLVYGWYFGLWRGVLLVSFASTTGATIAFLLSRFFFGSTVQRQFGKYLTSFNEALQREGPFYLLTLRLIPAVPFFVINAVMGLTTMRVSTYWWISQLGMLPGTAVYVYAGSSVPGLQLLAKEGIQAVFTPQQLTQITIAFVLLGLFPMIVRGLMKLAAPRRPAMSSPTDVS